MNKVIIGILVLLLVVTSALGYYSFDLLNNQIGSLSDELTTFKGETSTQIGTLSDELTAFKADTATQIGTLSDDTAKRCFQ